MQCHEDSADNIADDDADDRGNKAQAEHRGGEPAGHDGHDHDVRPKPDGEEVPGLAMAFMGRDRLDGFVFKPRYFRGGGAHDALLATDSSSRIPAVLLRLTISASRSKTSVAAARVVMSAWS